MKLVAVSVSFPRFIPWGEGGIATGIFKQPVAGRVAVRRTNLDGDGQGDLSVHGGPDKAVYAYPFEHYAHWKRELARDEMPFGQFGENFTVEGLLEDAVRIGDAFRVGTALVQVSQPRAPCFKLGIRMRLPEFPKRFLESGRIGFYLRVLEEGEVGAGDAIEPVSREPDSMTVREIARLYYFGRGDRAGIEKALGIGSLAASWRGGFRERLAALGTE
jgi:MOSC domain-containing protein YiiM